MKRKFVILIIIFIIFVLFQEGLGGNILQADIKYTREETFNFKRELLGSPRTLTIWLEKIDKLSGDIVLRGYETGEVRNPLIFSWGDGDTTIGWFPQTHHYEDTNRNYIITVTSTYYNGDSDSAQTVVFFTQPKIDPVQLDNKFLVKLPSSPVELRSSMPGYRPPTLSPIAKEGLILDRSIIEYVLSVASGIQADLVNYNFKLFNGQFKQFILRDNRIEEGMMYSLWFTVPPSAAVNKNTFINRNEWSSIFHEMGHNYTLNFPADFRYGGKTDGPGSEIYSETMAQIFQHATAYEIINNAEKFGIPLEIKVDIKNDAINTISFLRRQFDEYVNTGKNFSTFNDPNTPNDESFLTFMTAAYIFLKHVEEADRGYKIPVKRLTEFLSLFNSEIYQKYNSRSDDERAQTFRATFIVAAFSYALKRDLRREFRKLGFKINDKEFEQLCSGELIDPPTKPENLKLSQISRGIKLMWSFSSPGTYPISGYEIFRGTSRNNFKQLTRIFRDKNTYLDKDVCYRKTYYYKIRAFDTEGNYSDFSDIVSITVRDSTCPIIKIVQNVPYYVSSSSLNMEFVVSDDISLPESIMIRYSLDDSNWQEKLGNSISLTNLSEGKHILLVKAVDEAGNESEPLKIEFIVDLTPPNIEITSLEDNFYTNKETLNIKGSVSDSLSGVDRLTVNNEEITLKDKGIFEKEITLSEGENKIKIEAYDKAGNKTEKTLTVYLDTTPPHIDVYSPDKVNDPYLIITGSVKDNLSGIKYLKINGVNVSISSDGSFSYTITLNEGENTITLELEDKAGNKTRETFTVNYIKKIILRLTIGSRIAYVNNEPKTLEFSPFIKNDRTMMPLRFIAEGIGAKVLWFADESKVVIIHKNTFIELWMDQGKNI